MSDTFEGFDETRVDVGGVGGVQLRVRHGGAGPLVAPLLVVTGHTVVCPDLRGYGESSEPPTTADHGPHANRAMAGDVLALMRRLGHERFAVVGHDRGSHVAMRLALDAPQAVADRESPAVHASAWSVQGAARSACRAASAFATRGSRSPCSQPGSSGQRRGLR